MARVILQQRQLRDDHDVRGQQFQQRLRAHHIRLVPADHSLCVSGRGDVLLLLICRRRVVDQH